MAKQVPQRQRKIIKEQILLKAMKERKLWWAMIIQVSKENESLNIKITLKCGIMISLLAILSIYISMCSIFGLMPDGAN